jgi:hypothetical protein
MVAISQRSYIIKGSFGKCHWFTSLAFVPSWVISMRITRTDLAVTVVNEQLRSRIARPLPSVGSGCRFVTMQSGRPLASITLYFPAVSSIREHSEVTFHGVLLSI